MPVSEECIRITVLRLAFMKTEMWNGFCKARARGPCPNTVQLVNRRRQPWVLTLEGRNKQKGVRPMIAQAARSIDSAPSVAEIRSNTRRIRRSWTATERRQRQKRGQEKRAKIFMLVAKFLDRQS
jgi:hypothetical protein